MQLNTSAPNKSFKKAVQYERVSEYGPVLAKGREAAQRGNRKPRKRVGATLGKGRQLGFRLGQIQEGQAQVRGYRH